MELPQPAFPLELLSQPAAQRLAFFKACTIAHPRLQEVAQALVTALREPTGELLIFLYGPTGVGKTTVLRHGLQQIQAEHRSALETDPSWMPVLSVEAMAPERGSFDWRNYYADALRAFQEPLPRFKIQRPPAPAAGGSDKLPVQRRLESLAALRLALETAFQQRRPLAFFVDEAQHLTKLASGRKLQDQLDCLKSLAVRTQTVHVLAGTYELLLLRELSGQLSRRTRPLHFARYQAESAADQRDFQNVLWNFQLRLPLAATPDLLRHWEFCYERSLGCIGLLKDWLTRTLALALTEQQPQVTLKLLEQQALSPTACHKIATEIRAGEATLAESPHVRQHLRALLGLPESANSSVATHAQTPPVPQQPKRLGERNPKRDVVGVPHTTEA